jgi:DNA invertase Pin-like site-specific DNA recombinase
MTRVAILARVSTEEQADGHSLPAQLRTLHAFCEGRGWEVVRVVEAPGESASTSELARRPSIRELLGLAERGEVDVVLFHESSRLARDEELAMWLINRLERLGVRLVNASRGDMDYHSPEGRFLFSIDTGLDAYWRRKMGSHIRKGWAERFEKGLHMGPVPLGYARGASATDVLTVDPEEAAAVREAFAMRSRGEPVKAVAAMLMGRGLRPRSRQGYEGFTPSAVHSLLQNEFYAGWVRHGEDRRRGQHKAIISDEEWRRAQGSQGTKLRAPGTSDALLAGLVGCQSCGSKAWVHVSLARGHRYARYRESAPMQLRECADGGRMVAAREVDGQVGAIVRGIGLDADWLRRAVRSAHRPSARRANDDRRRLLAERERVGLAFSRGWLAAERAESEMARLDVALQETPSAPDAVIGTARQLQAFAEVWDQMELDERREVCRVVFERVWVDFGEHTVRVQPRQRYEGLLAARRDDVGGELPQVGIWVPSNTYSLAELGVVA